MAKKITRKSVSNCLTEGECAILDSIRNSAARFAVYSTPGKLEWGTLCWHSYPTLMVGKRSTPLPSSGGLGRLHIRLEAHTALEWKLKYVMASGDEVWVHRVW